ncbi:MAG: FtsX-like permease family protein, partial [bacterium]
SGILSIGFRKRQVLAILSGVAFLAALAGAVAGSVLGILYNYFLILGLNTVWKEAVNTPLLVMQVRIPALFTGFVSGAVTSLTVLTFVLLKNLRKPLSELVKNSTGIRVTKYNKSRFTCSMVVVVACFGAALAIMLRLMISGQASQNSLLLLAGGLILPGGLALLNLLLVKKSRYPVKEIPGLTALTIKNLALNRGRTITAVALCALGTFTIIITGANRKTADGDENSMKSGTGGFLLWSESTLPVMNSLNTASGKAKYGLNDEPVLQTAEFIQLTSLDGDDASCLNLNQVSQPKLLGVPPGIFDRRNAFTFVATDRMVDKAHPWKALSAGLSGDVIPGFADMSVIKWGLRKSPGDTLLYRAESGKVLKIKLVGGLDNSIFQGHILVSDSLLRLYYPSMAGSRIMLTAGSILQQNTIAQTFETLFRDYGMTAIPASERLASFNAVENTYLSVFMLLGGMGVIIGTVGLGIVLVANIARRRREFALYGALGFSKKFIFRLILAEHLVVLLAGLFLGTFSACAGIIPMLYGPKNNVPWIFITGILLAVLANGFLWIYFPARKIISRNFISGLRVE